LSTLADVLNERLKEIKDGLDKKSRGEAIFPSVPTGLRAWDKNGGILRGILTVLGAATGEGKSIVKLQLARGAAQSGHRVLMLDFEDPREKTADRAFSAVTGIDNRLLGLLNIEEFDLARLEGAIEELRGWAGRVVFEAGLVSVSVALERMRKFDGDLILVDYAQAFPEDEGKNMERTIANFAWEANSLAQKKNCAVVVFSQIVREVEERGYRIYERAKWRDPDKIDVSGFCPGGLSDISWAKTLGERSKELGYLWRENRIAKKLGANVRDNKMRVVWGKVNFGEEKDILLEFDGPTATIKDWTSKAGI
jgi:replicative DNA helicase